MTKLAQTAYLKPIFDVALYNVYLQGRKKVMPDDAIVKGFKNVLCIMTDHVDYLDQICGAARFADVVPQLMRVRSSFAWCKKLLGQTLHDVATEYVGRYAFLSYSQIDTRDPVRVTPAVLQAAADRIGEEATTRGFAHQLTTSRGIDCV